MDVKINAGLPGAAQPQKKPAAGAAAGASFADNLKAARQGGAANAPEAVFERALSDRENPDLQRLDDYLEGMIQAEVKKGGGL